MSRQKAWAVLVLETVGNRKGKFFLSEAVEYRGAAQRKRDEVKARHPDWRVKIVPCDILWK